MLVVVVVVVVVLVCAHMGILGWCCVGRGGAGSLFWYYFMFVCVVGVCVCCLCAHVCCLCACDCAGQCTDPSFVVGQVSLGENGCVLRVVRRPLL